MVYYGLEITANLIGLDSLQPRGGVDDPNHPYFIKLQCENCGEIGPRFSCVILSLSIPPPNGKGKVNMIQKCELCDRVGTVKMISGHGKPLTRALGESSRYAQIMVLECHGLAPVEFSFGDRWKAQSSKALWEIDLSEGEFHSDDERVHLTGLKAKFEVVPLNLLFLCPSLVNNEGSIQYISARENTSMAFTSLLITSLIFCLAYLTIIIKLLA